MKPAKNATEQALKMEQKLKLAQGVTDRAGFSRLVPPCLAR